MLRQTLVVLLVLSLSAAPSDHPQLQGMRLLPSYEFEPIPVPLDIVGGWIRNPNGAAFYFTYGNIISNLAEDTPTERLKWKKSQELGSCRMVVVLRDDNHLIITLLDIKRGIPFANFTGQILSDGDIVDAMLMVMSLPSSPSTQPAAAAQTKPAVE